jgi:hypothetical protein
MKVKTNLKAGQYNQNIQANQLNAQQESNVSLSNSQG